MAEQTRQPKNIFEQTLFGLQAVNDNIVAISQDFADTAKKIDAIYRALYPDSLETIEPMTTGATDEQ